jgi:hypothetical protein
LYIADQLEYRLKQAEIHENLSRMPPTSVGGGMRNYSRFSLAPKGSSP